MTVKTYDLVTLADVEEAERQICSEIIKLQDYAEMDPAHWNGSQVQDIKESAHHMHRLAVAIERWGS